MCLTFSQIQSSNYLTKRSKSESVLCLTFSQIQSSNYLTKRSKSESVLFFTIRSKLKLCSRQPPSTLRFALCLSRPRTSELFSSWSFHKNLAFNWRLTGQTSKMQGGYCLLLKVPHVDARAVIFQCICHSAWHKHEKACLSADLAQGIGHEGGLQHS